MTNLSPGAGRPVRELTQAEITVIEAGRRTQEEQRRVAALTKLAEIEDQSLVYAEYIASPEWRARSATIKERDGYHCRLCNGTEQLEVHHSSYEFLGNEPDTHLITLCHGCHSGFHETRRLKK